MVLWYWHFYLVCFVGKFANNLLFSKKDNNIKYVDGEITEGLIEIFQ